jgi:hypothetical protein
MSKLDSLLMSHNQISAITNALVLLPELKRVLLSDNLIELNDISPLLLLHMKKRMKLAIRGNLQGGQPITENMLDLPDEKYREIQRCDIYSFGRKF